ncbi:MAG: hypothetical protein H7844_14155 [Nitrospirae bacterium YQR-1]
MAKKPIEQCSHRDKSRVNNPDVGLVSPDTYRDYENKTYSYDPHLDEKVTYLAFLVFFICCYNSESSAVTISGSTEETNVGLTYGSLSYWCSSSKGVYSCSVNNGFTGYLYPLLTIKKF